MVSTVFDASGSIVPLNQQADLVGFFFDILSASAAAGDALTVDFTIQNSGDIPSGLFDVDFYISTDTTINSFDTFLGSSIFDVPAVSIVSSSITLSLPGLNSSFWAGSDTYYLGMVLDPTDAVDETNEANNSSVGLFFDYDEIFVTVDDAYEENDTLATAYDLSNNELTFLSSIAGAGIQADDDWYEIDVTPGFENLVVDLLFTHADGDLDLAVYNASGGLVTSATSVTDNESINVLLPDAGTYYLEVYGFPGNTFNSYDLIWDDVIVDDAYEENDTLATAYDLSNNELTFLSSIAGAGIQADDDWYEIDVTPGFENLVVDLLFTHADGDLDLAVYNASGGLVTSATSVTDNESINVLLPDAGTYYLEVYGFPGNTFNSYDLIWDDVIVDDAYEENDTLATAYDLSNNELTFLSSIAGAGIQADDDWYEIDVTPGFENLVVDLLFTHADGDLDLAVYNASGGLVTSATSVTDNESINVLLPDAGTYYLEVYGFPGNTFNSYDLIWDDQLYLVGTEERDVLSGTIDADTIIGLRGDDDLFGSGGDDELFGDRGDDDIIGGSGNDIVDGGRGDDVLNGVNPAATDAGLGEIDILIGGFGADVFEVGDFIQAYYDDVFSTTGENDYALITDFVVGEDVIQLNGNISDYQLGGTTPNQPSGVGIFLQTTGQSELVAIVQGSGTLDLASNSFSFV